MCKVIEERQIALKELGFNSYEEYLNSNIWKNIKSLDLKPGTKCKICLHYAKVLHHLEYDLDTLRGLKPENLIPLCNRCHKKIHFEDGKNYNPLEEIKFRTNYAIKASAEIRKFSNPCSYRPSRKQKKHKVKKINKSICHRCKVNKKVDLFEFCLDCYKELIEKNSEVYDTFTIRQMIKKVSWKLSRRNDRK